jgi:hypothetical protein
MDKIDPSRSMNELVLPRKVPEPSFLHMNKGAWWERNGRSLEKKGLKFKRYNKEEGLSLKRLV